MSATMAAGEARQAGATGTRGLRVVYLRDDDYPWDVRVEKICRALTDAGHEVHIAARNREGRVPLRETLAEGVVHRMAPLPMAPRVVDRATSFPAFFNPRWIAHLDAVVREANADAIIVRDLPLAPTAIGVGGRRGVPVLLDMAENYPAMTRETWDAGRHRPLDFLLRNPKLVAAVERWVVPRLDAVLTVVEESAARVRALGAGGDRVHVVSNTPPRSHAQGIRPARSEDGTLELVYLGLLEIPRGVGDLLDAVALLRGRGVKARATIIGDGRDAELFRARARTLGLGEDAARFTGYVRRDEALHVVARADVGVVPHHASALWNSTIPNKLFDYMAAGLPVVTSSAIPAARIVRETGAGEVFAARDATSLVAAVERLSSPDARATRGEAGRRAVLDRYNWERDGATLLDAVAATVARSRAGAGR
ncbi:MAG: glycosyltransferase family 4 protein [Gemmatimonadaceae bacterium]|nr:glycosyltransferase family 4 protein [Gemmatimonadaceae bacterium]NUR18270.1 glycosyltransferase family 4 protein [Gemmatimonadaceae bacterium]